MMTVEEIMRVRGMLDAMSFGDRQAALVCSLLDTGKGVDAIENIISTAAIMARRMSVEDKRRVVEAMMREAYALSSPWWN